MDLNCTRSISLHLLERRQPSTLPVIMRFAFACLVVLTLTMPARSQIEALQRGDIRSDDDILSSGSRKRGKRQGKKNVITPNMLQVLGADSIGDASLLNARPSRTARVSSLSRSLFETLQGTTFLVRPYLSDLRCVNDQSTNIFTALLDAPAGAAIAFPPGCIRAAGGLINNGRVWVGAGTGDEGTEFQFTGTEGAGLKLMGAGAQFDNFRVTCTANRATSQLVGIQMSDGVENPRGQRINRIKMKDCYDQIDVRSGEFWSITHFDMYRAARYGLRVRNLFESDSGDGSLTSGVIYTDVVAGGKAAIRWESGGGFKVSGTKTLQFDRCFDMAIADGVLTKILGLDSSNSFENPVTGECIKLGRIEGGTTGKFSDVNIDAQVTGAIGVYDGASNVKLSPVIGSSAYGIIVYGGDGVNISSAATMKDVKNGVIVRDPATNVSVGNFNMSGIEVAKIRDERVVGSGFIDRTDTRPLTLKPFGSLPLWQASLPPYSGAEITIHVQGLIQGSGTVNSRQSVLATRNDGAVSMASVSRTDGGLPITIVFDTVTFPGAVRVQVTNPEAANGRTFQGSAEIRIDGKTREFMRLPVVPQKTR